jgi:hypothetical protein
MTLTLSKIKLLHSFHNFVCVHVRVGGSANFMFSMNDTRNNGQYLFEHLRLGS